MISIVVTAAAGSLRAEDLKVLAGGSLAASMAELGPLFEQSSGHKVAFQHGGTPELIKLATSGVQFDLAIAPIDMMKDAGARATLAPEPPIDFARIGFGIAIRAGSPKIDVSSAEAVKQSLMSARSVSFYPESAAGAFVLKTFERLGISEAMKAKIRPRPPAQIAAAVASGDAELGVFLTNLLVAPGVNLVGPFPPELQQDLVLAAAVALKTNNADVANAFIKFLKSPAAAAVFRANGVTPG